jgi:hypothetical protein
MGRYFAEELLKTGKHTVTAITREGSDSKLPTGVKVVKVDYENEETIVSAFKGQQFVVITLSVFAPPENHLKLVNAAAKAGVPYIMPNSYGGNPEDKRFREDKVFGEAAMGRIKQVEDVGVSAWFFMSCGFWYEWSLAIGEQWYGFTIKDRKVTFFDDGETRIHTSTWIQCAWALTNLLSLKELPEDENDKSPTVAQFKNRPLYISSFTISQRDMLDSLHRVLGTTDKDWEIRHEPTEQRVKDGFEELAKGVRSGLAKAMYSRVFYKDGYGQYEKLDNEVLGLPKEDLDEATKRAVDMVESGWTPFAQPF